jgi:hypothetical protein
VLPALGCTLLYTLVALWPAAQAAGLPTAGAATPVHWFGLSWAPSGGTAVLLLVVSAGASGACLEAIVSFADRAGNRTLERGWLRQSLMRVAAGASVAAVVYLVLHLALFAGADVNPAGVAALSGLAGLCTRQATLRLVALARGEPRRRLAAWLR